MCVPGQHRFHTILLEQSDVAFPLGHRQIEIFFRLIHIFSYDRMMEEDHNPLPAFTSA